MSEISNNYQTGGKHLTKEEIKLRLAKRLCYILRYGAIKSGLRVTENGFVDLKELIKLPMLKWHSEDEILEELKNSISVKNVNRFEVLEQKNSILVRATYARNFEKRSCFVENEEKDSMVDSLFEKSLQTIMDNLEEYDLTDFPDEYIISMMIYRLKIRKKLTMKNLRILLVPTLEHMDLEGLYLTENIIKLLCKNCPYLKELNLKHCGYIITDTSLLQILKKLPELQTLNLAFCDHLTDSCLKSLVKYGQNIVNLNLNKIKNFSEAAILDFILKSPNLEKLEIYNVKLSSKGQQTVIDIARSRELKVTYRGLEGTDIAPEKPNYL